MAFNQNIARLKKMLENFAIPRLMMTGQLTGNRNKTYTDTKVLTVNDSGAVLSPTSSAQVYTLPAATDSTGCHFTFISGHSSAHVIKTTDSETTLFGAYVHNGGVFGSNSDAFRHVEIDDKKSLTHIVGSAIGDHLFFYCNGTQWIVEGMTHGAMVQA